MTKDDTITSDDILGKEAVDPNGAILGTVIKLHISDATKQIVGMTVDMGFAKPDLFVGVEFIKKFGVDAVLLNRMPTDKIKGLMVLSHDGEEVGTVKKVILYRTRIKELLVTAKEGFLTKHHFHIPENQIAKIGGSVILKKGCKLK